MLENIFIIIDKIQKQIPITCLITFSNEPFNERPALRLEIRARKKHQVVRFSWQFTKLALLTMEQIEQEHKIEMICKMFNRAYREFEIC